MGELSKIEWTGGTWNPWHGCKKVSPGCKNCYMYRDKERYRADPTDVLKSKTKFKEPLKWKEGKLIFTCSWSDWFIEEADEWRDEAWEVIRQTPQHTYQILTKRPERILDNLPDWFDEIADRVWIGVSVESENETGRIKYLLDPPDETIKFVSFEPLLGPIDWREEWKGLDWIIIGGESGNDNGKYGYRFMKLDWAIHLVLGGQFNGIPVFVKQLGTWQANLRNMKDRHGKDMSEFHKILRVREFPKEKSAELPINDMQ